MQTLKIPWTLMLNLIQNQALQQQIHDQTKDDAEDSKPTIRKRNIRTHFIYEFYRKVKISRRSF